jgi:copper transport protein
VRRPLAVVVGLVVAVASLLILAGPASAHASLETTDPANGAALIEAPSQIVLGFDESVDVALGAIRLYDGTGHEIDVGPSHHQGDNAHVAVNVPEIGPGAYVVSWRVVSADSHPVHGAFTFQVGTGDVVRDPGLITRLLSQEGGNPSAGAALGVSRFLSYAALALVVGGLAFLSVVWPAGGARRRVRVLLWAALGIGVVAGLVGIAVQAPYASGRALSDALKPSQWWQVLRTSSGRAWGLRVVVLGAVGAGLLLTLDRLRTQAWRIIGVLSAAAVFVLVAMGGHGTTGRWAAIGLLATVAHLGGMAVWLGGLAVLLAGVLQDPDPADGLARVRRFSPIAFGAVAVIVVSGVVQAYRQVGSLDALTGTDYGRLLLVKTAFVVAAVAVAWVSRRLIQESAEPAPVALAAGAAVLARSPTENDAARRATRRRLRRAVGAEVALTAAVLVVTSLLVASAPAIADVSKPFNATITQRDRLASITVDPAATGRNTMHVYISTPGGALEKAQEITVRITLPSRDLGPIPVPVEDAGPNHVLSNNLQLPFSGDWQVEILARFGEADQVRFATTMPVGS